jgi:nucleoporin NUP159
MTDDGDASKEKVGGSFGLGGEDFKLGSTFKAGTSKAELDIEDGAPKAAPKKPLFGADFGAAINDTKTSEPKIKEEPQSPVGLFGKREEPKSLFGQPSSFTRASPSIFGQPSAPIPAAAQSAQSEPPEVTSKPQPSPSPATGPSSGDSSASHPSGSDDDESVSEGSVSEAGSPAEAVEMPESDGEESEDTEEVVDDAPLPPDPTTVKTRPSWFNEAPPGASGPPAAQKMPPPKAPSPPPPPAESPLFPSKTTTPIGFPKAPISFAKPMTSLRESPRSPSPIRSASTPVGKSFAPQRVPSRPISHAAASTPVVPQPPPPEPEQSFTASDLSDDEDERIRLELEGDIEPTLQLSDFIAHQDYVGQITKKDGLPNQIERMYRDINSMVDTLGLNARTLAAFIQGHEELQKDSRTKQDLDITGQDDDEWCLVEVEEIEGIEDGLEAELDAATIAEPHQSVLKLKQMRKDLIKTRQKLTEVRKFLDDSKSSETKAKIKNAPLDLAHANKQRELRGKFSEFQTKLVKAEEGAVVLKTKLAGVGGAGGGGRVPTVEAVENTIRKMTAMAEERSGDIDVLEKQMRGLGLVPDSRPSSSSRMAVSMRSSGLFSSPKRNGGGRTFGFPEEEEDTEGEDGVLVGRVSSDSVANVLELRGRRKVAKGVIKEAIRKRGVRVVHAS